MANDVVQATPAATSVALREQPAAPVIFKPQKGPQAKSLSSPADILIYGGSAGGGKTFGLLLETLRYHQNPLFDAIIFRATYPQITNPGGLWDESNEIYPYFGATPSITSLGWKFLSGAKVKFAHMNSDQTRLDYQGTQVAMIGFDELCHFSSVIFWYMISRIRSMSGVPGIIRCTCNPDPESWVARFISWWIDWDTGYPIKERSGVLRWFLRRGDDLIWGDSKEELMPQCAQDEVPTSVTFIASSIYDNQILLRKDPVYLSRLLSMPMVEREQLLKGNWKIRKSAGTMFRREWFKIVDTAPEIREKVRYWDRAASTPEESDNPDWTVGELWGKTPENQFYVLDVVRFQGTPLEVEQRIANIASQDGPRVMVALEHDPGQAGKMEASYYTRKFAGLNIRMIPTGGKAKIERATPYSAQVQAGNVKLLRAHWNDLFITEHENFPPTGKGKDDQVDSGSGSILVLTQGTSGVSKVLDPVDRQREVGIDQGRQGGRRLRM